MGLYGFKDRFVPAILSGDKTHTIRDIRRYPDKPGNTLYLYSGLRTKRARLLMRATCLMVEEIQIIPVPGMLTPIPIVIGGIELSFSEKEALARRDGFTSLGEMILFWRQPKDRLPFRGHIIHWRAL